VTLTGLPHVSFPPTYDGDAALSSGGTDGTGCRPCSRCWFLPWLWAHRSIRSWGCGQSIASLLSPPSLSDVIADAGLLLW